MIFEIGAKLEEDELSIQGTKAKKVESKKVTTKSEILDKKAHQLVFKYEKRNGKPVTLVGRFSLSLNDKKEVLKLLKKKLACGGTINDEWLEIQGDVKDKIKDILENSGWKFRK